MRREKNLRIINVYFIRHHRAGGSQDVHAGAVQVSKPFRWVSYTIATENKELRTCRWILGEGGGGGVRRMRPWLQVLEVRIYICQLRMLR
jgi:hypothetical protein